MGHGSLELGLYADPVSAGARATYAHRLSEEIAAFAQAEAGYRWGDDVYGRALAGVEWRF